MLETEKHKKIALLAQRFLQMKVALNKENFSDKTYDKILAEQFGILLWKYSEAEGKYEGCPYWSKYATDVYRQHGRVVTSKTPRSERLRHEHLVPRKILIDMFFSLQDISLQNVQDLFRKYCIGVVITAEEDDRLNAAGLKQKMPVDDWEKDPWIRYKKVGINLAEKNAP